jgi:hypothetical protein
MAFKAEKSEYGHISTSVHKWITLYHVYMNSKLTEYRLKIKAWPQVIKSVENLLNEIEKSNNMQMYNLKVSRQLSISSPDIPLCLKSIWLCSKLHILHLHTQKITLIPSLFLVLSESINTDQTKKHQLTRSRKLWSNN